MYVRRTDIKPFDKKVWLASPTMHGDELKYITEAYDSNWMSTVGANINEVEHIAAQKAEMKYAVALSSCTAALHLAMILAGVKRGDARLFAVLLVKDLRDAVAQGRFGAVRPGAVVGVQLCLPAQRLRQPRETRGHGILLGIDA